MANSEMEETISDNCSGYKFHSFTIFWQFLIEIRLKIWKEAMPGPRIEKLNCFALSLCKHAMVRVRSDRIVLDRCYNDNYNGSYGTTCGGCLDILPQDMKSPMTTVRKRNEALAGFCSEMKPPNLFFVCKESYEFTLKRYKSAFPALGALSEIYFDYERDVLFLCAEYLERESAIADSDSHLMVRAEAGKVQNLSFSFDKILFERNNTAQENLRDRSVFVGHLLEVFCNLKTLTIEVEDHAEFYNDAKFMG